MFLLFTLSNFTTCVNNSLAEPWLTELRLVGPFAIHVEIYKGETHLSSGCELSIVFKKTIAGFCFLVCAYIICSVMLICQDQEPFDIQ